jgi:hypothetical protein
MYPVVQPFEVDFQIQPVLLPHHPINPRRSFWFQAMERPKQAAFVQVMKQCGELHFLVLARILAHSFQLRGHIIVPALRPGCAQLDRVSLD